MLIRKQQVKWTASSRFIWSEFSIFLVLEQFDPTRNIEKAMPPITKPMIAQKALGLLTRVRYLRKLTGS